jgi:hypothetical protein
MAFSWLKKAVTAPINLVGKVIKKVSPVVKVAKPVLKPIYDMAMPGRVRKAIQAVKVILPVMKLFKRRSKNEMNELEAKLRTCVQLSIEMSGKKGVDLALNAGLLMQSIMAFGILVKSISLQQLVDDGILAIDGMTGNEANALIGPQGSLIELDIPLVDDEKLYDLITGGVRIMLTDLIDKAAQPPTDG